MSTKATRIHFNIGKTGIVTVKDVDGAGANCRDVTASIEKALGVVDEKSREATANAFQDAEPLKLSNHLE